MTNRPQSRCAAFTLIELMIVVAVISIIAAIAIPNLLAARVNANEAAAISALRNISTAQAQLQAACRIDVDQDGIGEFGHFQDLTGVNGYRRDPLRQQLGPRARNVPLSSSFARDDGNGVRANSGYRFRIHMPRADQGAIWERGNGQRLPYPVDTDFAETMWCAYAWPESPHSSERRVFFLNHEGLLTTHEVQSNSLSSLAGDLGPDMGSALALPGWSLAMVGRTVVNEPGRTGIVWRLVN